MKYPLFRPLAATAIVSGLALVAATDAAAAKPGDESLSLNATLNGCTFTINATWAGFQQAKFLQVFVTDGFSGTAIFPTDARVQNKDSTLSVTIPALTESPTPTVFYPWAQLLDARGNPIPASLDFASPQQANCAAPAQG